MWSSRMEGPGLDMLETWKIRKTREKEKVFLDTFGSFDCSLWLVYIQK